MLICIVEFVAYFALNSRIICELPDQPSLSTGKPDISRSRPGWGQFKGSRWGHYKLTFSGDYSPRHLIQFRRT